MLETQKPLKDTSAVIVPHGHSRRASLLKTPNRNSIELSETKIIEEINICIRKIVNSQLKNEIVLNQSSLYNVKLEFNQKFAKNLDLILKDDFDIFSFDEDCLKHSLYTLMNYYHKIYQLDQIKISENRFLNLIYNMEKR